jgi:hypothetical protein
MRENLPVILWRLVPTVLFLGGAVPLFVRAIRGVIPAHPYDGSDAEVTRRATPALFWRRMTIQLIIAVALTMWLIAAWLTQPPETDAAARI